LAIVVSVNIHESGRDNSPRRIDFFSSGLLEITDRNDPISDDTHIHDAAWRTRTIHDKATRNFQIVHPALLLFATTVSVPAPTVTNGRPSAARRIDYPFITGLEPPPDRITTHHH
jgi:hypothetical protein